MTNVNGVGGVLPAEKITPAATTGTPGQVVYRDSDAVAVQQPAPIQGEKKITGEQQILDAVRNMEEKDVPEKEQNRINKEFQFSVHEATKAICVKVINKDTGDVIKEIPSEKILDMVAKMCELAGIFVDEKI